MKKIVKLICMLIFISALVTGCSGFRHGYTKSDAKNQYLKVDVENKNFGYKRVQAIIDFRGKGIESFVEEKGFPEYIYEYEKKNKEGADREGFIFYYLNELKAYDFWEENWRPTSARIVEIRDFTEFENSRLGISK